MINPKLYFPHLLFILIVIKNCGQVNNQETNRMYCYQKNNYLCIKKLDVSIIICQILLK